MLFNSFLHMPELKIESYKKEPEPLTFHGTMEFKPAPVEIKPILMLQPDYSTDFNALKIESLERRIRDFELFYKYLHKNDKFRRRHLRRRLKRWHKQLRELKGKA